MSATSKHVEESLADRTSDPAAVDEPGPEVPAVELTAQSVPRWAVIGMFLLLLVAGIAYARVFLMPVVLAFLLALVFSPVRRFLERRGVPAALSAGVIVTLLLAVLLAGAMVLAEPVQEWIDDAPEIGRQIEEKVRDLMGSAQAFVEAGEQVNQIASGSASAQVQEVVVKEPSVLATLASVAPAVLTQVLFILVLVLLLLASGDMFYEKLVHVMGTFKDKRRAIRIAYDIERKLSRYLFTITLVNAGLGVAIGTAMWLLGMPNPMLFGVVGFALNYVPFVGAVVGMSAATLVGLLSFDEVTMALMAGSAYFALNVVESQFITPYFVGRRLEMNTVVVFLSIAFWAWLWSVVGMLVAVPLLVTIRVFSEHVEELHSLGEFLSARRDGTDTDDESP